MEVPVALRAHLLVFWQVVDDLLDGQPRQIEFALPGKLAAGIGNRLGLGFGDLGSGARLGLVKEHCLLPHRRLFALGSEEAMLSQSEWLFEPLVLGFEPGHLFDQILPGRLWLGTDCGIGDCHVQYV
jgi:hypothetical protein